MALVDFYHLSASPIEKVLPRICERVAADGGRLLVVADDRLLAELDRLLWSYSRDSFLPHGRADGAAAEDQPVLLSTQCEAPNGARNVALADGEWREEALAFDRTFFFFDDARRDSAREAWRALKGRPETTLRYWKQEGGKWVEGP